MKNTFTQTSFKTKRIILFWRREGDKRHEPQLGKGRFNFDHYKKICHERGIDIATGEALE